MVLILNSSIIIIFYVDAIYIRSFLTIAFNIDMQLDYIYSTAIYLLLFFEKKKHVISI